MRILFDGFIYREQRAGGIGRYFNSIIRRLPSGDVPVLVTEDSHLNVDLPVHPNLKQYNYANFRPNRVSTFSKKYYYQYINRFKPFDLIHPTYYTLLSGEKISSVKGPKISTIHDMIYEVFQDKINNAHQHVAWKRDAIESSEVIICVSENTKKDLLRFYPDTEHKIRVIYEGTELTRKESFGDESIPPEPYFLYVGGRNVYKNFNLLLDVFPTVTEKYDTTLCIVGPPLTESENKRIASLNIGHRIRYYGYVSNPHLAKLYRSSIALVYPSLYEGFGLPPLEAMSCGAPVIASNRSSIPEVVGDAGILFDPDQKDELIDAMALLLSDNATRERCIEQGFKRAMLFEWDRNILPMIDIYHSFSN
jgi:glycosyltransferase involved in cell wall biosynthesis